MTEAESLILLNSIPGLGNIRLHRLLKHFESARAVFLASAKDLVFEGRLPLAVAEEIRKIPCTDQLRQEIELIKRHKVEIITILSPDYPALLKETVDAPVLLYIKGRLPQDNLAIAVVGSRSASVYGLTMAEKLAMQLSEYGITVVSGLARGIDTAAHRGALKAKGTTVAVLGSGLANIYPKENEGLAQAVSENGVLVSEFAMATSPLTHNFPRRNRIISGLSLGVAVIEASQKSGALITANMALEQGREVFALPGKVDNPNSAGAHQLIKTGAKLMTGIEDILEELKPQLQSFMRREAEEKEDRQEISLNSDEIPVFQCINSEPLHIDALISLTNMSLTELNMVLLRLEMKGLVQQMPGHFFKRVSKEVFSKSHV